MFLNMKEQGGNEYDELKEGSGIEIKKLKNNLRIYVELTFC